MGKQYEEISDAHREFIENQKIFFVGTAGAEGRVNVSPKGMDSFRVLGANKIAWLNVTGSGNETSAHVQENPRMTIMFTALEGKPLILRLYGKAKVIHQNDPEWDDLYGLFPDTPGARQIFEMEVDLVQNSCGMGVPYYDYVEERQMLDRWADKQGEQGVANFWEKNNQVSLDGQPTHIMEKNT